MHALSDAALLELWEQGRARHPIDRALLLYGAARPQLAPDALADQPLGQRDAAILELRNQRFGARIDGYGQCPACGERFEFQLDGRALMAAAPPAANAEFRDAEGHRLRLPSSRDLARVACSTEAEQELARLCMLDDAPLSASDVAQRIAAHDPAADLSLALCCEACGQQWETSFDPASYCWEEIEALATRLLDEVHHLARAYGWSEPEVLRLTPARRAAYLERCGA